MELRTEVEIAAPSSHVWRVLTDLSSYPEWNPFITEIAGELVEGAELDVSLSVPEGRDLRFRPRLIRYEVERELRWRGHFLFAGLFDGEHFFRLEAIGPDRTRFVHGENFTGLLVRFASSTLSKAARGFVYMNRALKRRVEEG